MMYCLRTFLPLLLLPLPLSLSPIHLTTLLILTYILNKPCAYCSLLLVILFASSCHWSGRCFWGTPFFGAEDIPGTTNSSALESSWIPYFLPRLYTIPSSAATISSSNTTAATDDLTSFLLDLTNSTISTLAASAASSIAESTGALATKFAPPVSIPPSSAAGGVGTQWLRNLLGAGEWTLPCVNIKLVL
jgi:hypothetical protein